MANKVSSFLRAVRGEMKKVSWPGRSEIIKSTIVVIVTIILFALIIGGMDIAFFQILQVIFR